MNSTMEKENNSPKRSNMGKYLSLAPPRIYYCYFCPRSFTTKQALGGHQNGHRQDMEKVRQFFAQGCEFSAATSKSNAVVVSESQAPSNGSGLKADYKPRFGQRFEPYSRIASKCYRQVDLDIAWVFKDGLAPLGLSSTKTDLHEDETKYTKEFEKKVEEFETQGEELVNLDLSL